MTPDQVSGFFDAGESFIEGTIGAALVVLWLMALALHLGRPYMVRTTGKFTLRLGADLWWIIYVGLRDLIVVQVFLGSFIFFYPDVVAGQDLPITGGLAAVCAFAVLLIKLTRPGDETAAFRAQVLLLGLGATLYIAPYFFGVQMTRAPRATRRRDHAVPGQFQEPGPRLAAVLPVLGADRPARAGRRRLQPALDRSATGRVHPGGRPMSADDLAQAMTHGASGWLVLSVAAVLPILWTFTLVMHFARPAVIRFLQSLTLRFGGDVWWLSYVLFRDALLVITLGLGMLFFMPNLYFVGDGLPITAPLSVLVLFWALCVKIIRDPDEDPAAFRLLSVLLVIASVLYIVPQIYGLESADQAYLGDLPTPADQHRQPAGRPAAVLAEPGAVRSHRRRHVPAGLAPAARPERGCNRRPGRGRLTGRLERAGVGRLSSSRGGSRSAYGPPRRRWPPHRGGPRRPSERSHPVPPRRRDRPGSCGTARAG